MASLKITVLSTMLAEEGLGEWGFAALVDADGRRILFDTGARPSTVLENAKELGLDLSGIEEVILSHNHGDHTGGLLTLRRELRVKNPKALTRAHVGKGIFWSRPRKDGSEANPMIALRRDYEAAGGAFVEHDSPIQIAPGLWLTGPVPRVHPERNWSPGSPVRSPEGVVEDTLPEDQSLVANTDRGLVLLAGCGHAGVVNTALYARKIVREVPLHA
ncbi:MAG TPA: MBL fold metallo-hydrolase, partial [Vicinamibacteria bacterium]|nr:MBL fold metallo-hydrolase [Vicinamibacteria bacterium]